MEGGGFDDVEGQAPDPQQIGADLGVGDAQLLGLDQVDRSVAVRRGADDLRVALGHAQRQHDAPDVVDDGGAEHFVGLLAVVQEPLGQLRDQQRVVLHLLEREALDGGHGHRAEDVSRDGQHLEQLEAEVGHRLGNGRDGLGGPEVRRVDQLQDLRRHRRVLLDDLAQVGEADVGLGRRARELPVDRRAARGSCPSCRPARAWSGRRAGRGGSRPARWSSAGSRRCTAWTDTGGPPAARGRWRRGRRAPTARCARRSGTGP